MNLYTKTGRPDYDVITANSSTLNFLIGGRRIGKTYGFLAHWLTHGKSPFLYIRSTPRAVKNVFTAELSPFTPINADFDVTIVPEKIPGTDIIGIYDEVVTTKKGKLKPAGDPVGYACALSQIGDIRGFNLDNVTDIFYDEFIKHPGEIIRNYADFGTMFLDILITVNNERETRGRRPVKSWLMGNSDNMSNPILYEFGLLPIIYKMQIDGQSFYKDGKRGISIFLFLDAPISDEYKKNSMGRLLEGTSYGEMAYENEFVNDDFTNCCLQPMGQYLPLFSFGKYTVYTHRTKERYYVAHGANNSVRNYPQTPIATNAMIDTYGYLYYALTDNNIYFADYDCKYTFCKAFRFTK